MPPDTTPPTPTSTTAPASPDISPTTEASYNTLSPVLASTTPSKTKSLNLKIASTLAYQLHAEVHQPDAAAQFAKLPSELFDRTRISLLLTCAQAASFVYGSQQTAKALKNADQARLSKDLVDTATALRLEMITVAGYALSKDTEAAAILAHIRAGKGYEDLASDLDLLARLYTSHKDTLQEDRLRYRAEHAQRARDLDTQITKSLDDSRRERIAHWNDQAARITVLLRSHYEEVVLTARWLLRAAPDLDLRFPLSLYVSKRNKKPSKPATEPVTEPATEPTAS
jgi:hypothetical protein